MKKLMLIAAIFYLAVFFVASGQENNSDKILEIGRQIQKLEKQSVEYKKQITQKHAESETLKKELAILESRIAKLQVDVSVTNRKIELTNFEIKDLNVEINQTENKIDKNKESISEVLRQLDVSEKKDFAIILLTNSKISDFFNHIEHINNLQGRLTLSLTNFIELKKEFDIRKETAKSKKLEMVALNTRRQNQKMASETAQSTKNDLLVKTKGQEQKFQQLLTEAEKKKAEFYQELQVFEAEARKQGIYIVRVKAPLIPSKGIKLFKMPLDDYIITQGYGMTVFAKREAYGGAPHNGIDMTDGPGSEIKSIGSGAVLAKGYNNAGGNWLAIRHDNDLVSVYGHMKNPALVLAGEKVDQNTVIGYEGATGFVTGPHLHLSLYHEFFTFIGPKTGQVYFNYFDGSLNPLDYMQ